MTAIFPGRESHCYEFRAVLCDASLNDWLVEGVNVTKLKDGLIAYMRSFEDVPRRMSAGGGAR